MGDDNAAPPSDNTSPLVSLRSVEHGAPLSIVEIGNITLVHNQWFKHRASYYDGFSVF
jgi:hypothetical protein